MRDIRSGCLHSRCRLLGLQLLPPLDIAKRSHLLLDAIFVNLDLIRLKIAHQMTMFVANYQIQNHFLGTQPNESVWLARRV
jgi:hypothetical protein